MIKQILLLKIIIEKLLKHNCLIFSQILNWKSFFNVLLGALILIFMSRLNGRILVFTFILIILN